MNTGEVYADCRSDHQISTIIDVFESNLQSVPQDEPLDYMMDNLNSHCYYELCQLIAKYSQVECPPEKQLDTMQKRRQWLMQDNKRLIFHYTPYHGSWLNQVEYWFAMLNQKCLKETYQSANAIFKAIQQFVGLYNQLLAKPFNWNYTGEGLQKKNSEKICWYVKSDYKNG